MARNKVIIVGGGAAGLMAAGQAAQHGADVLLLEKMNLPGRKLCITGKGRCNLTNSAPMQEFVGHFGPNGRFLYQAFSRFFTQDLVSLLSELGIPTIRERGGRIFPKEENGIGIVDAFINWIRGMGVKIITRSIVEHLLIDGECISGVEVISPGPPQKGIQSKRHIFPGNRVVIATGGASYPDTGSTGDGYRLADSVSHTIIPVRPALVPLNVSGNITSRLEKLNLRNVNVRLYINNKKEAEMFGEMGFIHSGVSGPVILTMSKQVVDSIRMKKKVSISIDLKPALDFKKLDQRLLRDLDKQGKRQFQVILKGLLPKRLIPLFLDLTAIHPETAGNQITAQERKLVVKRLKDFRVEIDGYAPISEAIITAGGVALKEIDPRTMESRLVKGLYFAGEVLDIDGDTGGFNLQAAFSTGYLAGRSAALNGKAASNK